MKNFYSVVLMLAICLIAVSCSENDKPGNSGEAKRIELSDNTRSVVAKNNDFSLKISSEIFESVSKDINIQGNMERNVLVSPFSLYVELAMLANTDDAEISREIMTTLGFGENESSDVLQEFCSKLLRELPSVDGNVECSISNGLWSHPELTITEEFANSLKNTYYADLFVGSPTSMSVIEEINRWAESKTNGMIKKLHDNIIGNNWYLVNATYFKGEWSSPFNKGKTAKKTFHSFDGADASVDFMNKVEELPYIEKDSYQAVSLGYGNGGFRMTLILPDMETSVDEVMSSLDSDEFYALQNWAAIYEVTLSMPKFSLKSKRDISNDLINMGLSSIFFKELTGLFTSPVTLNNLSQAITIETDEAGTKAAVVTGENDIVSPGLSGKVSLTFDRPFAFIISEVSTGSILFTGKVVKL